MLLYSLIFLPFAGALLGYLIGRKNETAYYWLALAITAAEFVLAVVTALQPGFETGIQAVLSLGLHLKLDGFRKVYLLVITLMWMMTMALSKDYFHGHHALARYFFFNLMTLGATIGVFVSADLFTALVFFEIMSFTSFPWVIQEETDGAIKAANTYLAVAVIGGLTALMGLFLLYNRLGTLEIEALYERAQMCNDKASLYVAGACILVGFGAKAGMFPLHIWLPKAHPVAPAPASSLLSGVLTKSGVFGILVISGDLLRYDPKWGMVILTLGTITMFLGALLALFSIDLKRTLACSSMSQIGFILIGVGMMGLLGEENALAARGALLHMVNHSLFKLVLFMCAGVVYMNLHVLDLNEVRGFGRGKWLLNICFLLAALGIGGIPGLNGYISKTLLHESIVEGAHEYGVMLKVVEWIFLISGGLTLAYMTKLYVCLFVEKSEKPAHEGHFGKDKKQYLGLLSALAIGLSALILPVLGLGANVLMNGIADVGTDFFHAGELEESIHYFSLENLKGAFISLAIGAAVYFLIVRKLLMKDGKYVNVWPVWLDLEDSVYRPLLLKVLPAVFGWISSLFADNVITGWVYRTGVRVSGILSRFICDLTDLIVLAFRRTAFKEVKVKVDNRVHHSAAYRLGRTIDRRKEKDGSEKAGEHRYARLLYRMDRTIGKTIHNLSDTLSFALLMLCIALFAVFVYLFLM